MEPRVRRAKIVEAIEKLSDAEKDELTIRDSDWAARSGTRSTGNGCHVDPTLKRNKTLNADAASYSRSSTSLFVHS